MPLANHPGVFIAAERPAGAIRREAADSSHPLLPAAVWPIVVIAGMVRGAIGLGFVLVAARS